MSCVLPLQRTLGLRQQQRSEIVQLRRLFLSKMNSIVQQRREIHQSLAVSTIHTRVPLSLSTPSSINIQELSRPCTCTFELRKT